MWDQRQDHRQHRRRQRGLLLTDGRAPSEPGAVLRALLNSDEHQFLPPPHM